MKILSSVAANVTKAIDFVVEANRKNALINRIKAVVRCEEKNIDRAYIALGKYYYNNLREKELEETERHCLALENSKRRLDRALTRLEELTEEDEEEYDEYSDYEDCYCSECGTDFADEYDDYGAEQELRQIDGVEEYAAHGEPVYEEEHQTEPDEPGEAATDEDGKVIPPNQE